MRITRKQMWMGMAELAAKRSTCFRGNVGAIVVWENTPISIGYNGPPSGEPHCHGNGCPLIEGGCSRSVHAEINAIDRLPFAMDAGDEMAEMYVTSGPCPNCSTAIIDSGIFDRVYYQSPYRIGSGLKAMIDHGIKVFRFTPSGYLINEATSEVLEAN